MLTLEEIKHANHKHITVYKQTFEQKSFMVGMQLFSIILSGWDVSHNIMHYRYTIQCIYICMCVNFQCISCNVFFFTIAILRGILTFVNTACNNSNYNSSKLNNSKLLDTTGELKISCAIKANS